MSLFISWACYLLLHESPPQGFSMPEGPAEAFNLASHLISGLFGAGLTMPVQQ